MFHKKTLNSKKLYMTCQIFKNHLKKIRPQQEIRYVPKTPATE